MKFSSFIILLSNIILFNTNSFAENKDSIYVKLNKINPNIISILLDVEGKSINKGNISIISVSMKNKYGNVLRFMINNENNLIHYMNKEALNKQKSVIDYKKLNQLLDEDFFKVVLKYEIFFIMIEDKNRIYGIKVKPILPIELNKM
jgi:hypothetical protein